VYKGENSSPAFQSPPQLAFYQILPLTKPSFGILKHTQVEVHAYSDNSYHHWGIAKTNHIASSLPHPKSVYIPK
jgi:hypothetical protein